MAGFTMKSFEELRVSKGSALVSETGSGSGSLVDDNGVLDGALEVDDSDDDVESDQASSCGEDDGDGVPVSTFDNSGIGGLGMTFNSSIGNSPWNPDTPSWSSSPTIVVSLPDASSTSEWANIETSIDSSDDEQSEQDHSSSSNATATLTVPPREPQPSLAHLLTPPLAPHRSPLFRLEMRSVRRGSPVAYKTAPESRFSDDIGSHDGDVTTREIKIVVSSLESDGHQEDLESPTTIPSITQQQETVLLDPILAPVSEGAVSPISREQLEQVMRSRLEAEEQMAEQLNLARDMKQSQKELIVKITLERNANMHELRGLAERLRAIAREEQIVQGLTRQTYLFNGVANDLDELKHLIQHIGVWARVATGGTHIAILMLGFLALLLTLTGIAMSWNVNAGLKMLVLMIAFLLCWPVCAAYCIERIGGGASTKCDG